MDFRIGDQIEIIMAGASRQPFSSKIIGVVNQSIYIMAPTQGQEPLAVGTTVQIGVSKKGDALYECVTKIVEIENGANFGLPEVLNILRIEIPASFFRNQRRSYVRVDVRIPVEILYFMRDGYPVTAYTVSTVNLSAGGVRLETPGGYPAGSKLRLALRLPQNPEIEEVMVTAEVVRSEPVNLDDENILMYETALRFVKIPQIYMKKILKFVYKQQELLAKSLI